MEIEIVEFYLTEKKGNKFTGSLHVYLIESGIDLRGIFVGFNFKKDPKWRFFMPSKKGYDEELKKEVQYPVFQFADRAKQKELLDALYDKARPYIKAKVEGIETKEKVIFKKFQPKPSEKKTMPPISGNAKWVFKAK